MNHKVRKARRILAAITFIVAVVWFSSCEKFTITFPEINPVDTLSFQADIQPIFDAKCVSCHGGAVAPNLSNGKSYRSLDFGGYLNQPPEENRLYIQMSAPSHISRSTDTDRQMVFVWVGQGALDN